MKKQNSERAREFRCQEKLTLRVCFQMRDSTGIPAWRRKYLRIAGKSETFISNYGKRKSNEQ